jgi:hypothetical protein
MQEMKHTPEPWAILSELTTNEEAPVQVGTDDVNSHKRIIAAQINAYSFWGMTVETANANAARIVLCVNKCAGLTNEELEALPPVKKLAKKLETALDYNQYFENNLRMANEWVEALKTENSGLETDLKDALDRHAEQRARKIEAYNQATNLQDEILRLKSRNLWQRIFNL